MQTAVDDSRFNIIASSYEYAIATYPKARMDTDWLMDELSVEPRDKILEISAGTGFLTQQIAPLNTAGVLYAQDIAPRTLDINRKKNQAFNHIQYILDVADIPNESCDKAVSLGGWHHMEDQISVTRNALSKVKKGGYFCVGDFADNSSIQRYFDEVVDKITSTGHQALFPSESRMINLGRFSSAKTVHVDTRDVPFKFKSEAEVGEFFQRVFALDQEPLETYSDISRYFHIRNIGSQLAVMVPYIYATFHK